MVSNLSVILGEGWRPPREWEDPVVWHPRSSNVVADFLANYTMDIKESWSKTLEWPFEGCDLANCNIVVHSDGGTRARHCSAAAFVIEVGRIVEGRWCFKPLVLSGTYIEPPVSSFCAEVLALEESSLCLKHLLTRLGKRPRRSC